ncbi:MAG: 4Fe-4S cluster-binding domain-containing protein [Anaerolineales bacterium]|nr:4Fe-4S cluster-binding domain-containing protein [Anaerolineales bacterium]
MIFQPTYLDLLLSGDLKKRAADFQRRLKACDLCPRDCGVNRVEGEIGFCGVGNQVWVNSYGLHFGEEDPLRGWQGSGTIFFSGCNLSCLYCQNAEISQKVSGSEISVEVLANVMLELENRGAHNINLVSPTHVIAQIIKAIYIAAQRGLKLPIVYNTGGYDSIHTLKMLDGIIDIYMPDMKYSEPEISGRLSGVPDYPSVNQIAVKEMFRQVGNLVMSTQGIAERGLLVRHLVLPGGLAGSKTVLEFIAKEISRNTYLNIMDQYRPAYLAGRHSEINRRITSDEYQVVVKEALRLGLNRLDKC